MLNRLPISALSHGHQLPGKSSTYSVANVRFARPGRSETGQPACGRTEPSRPARATSRQSAGETRSAARGRGRAAPAPRRACAAACAGVGAGSMPSSLPAVLLAEQQGEQRLRERFASPGRARPGCARRAWRCAGRRRCCAGSGRVRGTGRTRPITSWCRPTSSSEWTRLTMRAASVSSVSRSRRRVEAHRGGEVPDHRGEQPGLVAVVGVESALGHLSRGRELVDRARAVAAPQEDAEGGR